MAKDDIGRFGIAQEILRKSADFLRRFIDPVVGMGGATLLYGPHCSICPLGDYIRWVSTRHGDGNRRSIATGGVQLVEADANGKPTGYWAQLGVNANEGKVFKAHAAHLRLSDNLINALKLLANQQKDGDSPIQSIATGLHERSRRGIMDGLGSFIKANNQRAVDVGHLREGTIPLHVRKPKFSEAYPEAAIRERAYELTLRADEVETLRAFIKKDHIDFDRWEPPLVDADWHAFFQAMYRGIEGEQWEELSCHYTDMSKVI